MFSRTTENNNKQRDKKDQIDIFTNNHDKKYHSTKHLKGLQFFMAFHLSELTCQYDSCRNDNFTFNQNSPATTSQILNDI